MGAMLDRLTALAANGHDVVSERQRIGRWNADYIIAIFAVILTLYRHFVCHEIVLALDYGAIWA